MQRVFWNSICPALNHIPDLMSSFSSHWLLETILRIPCFYSNRPSKFPLQYLEGSPPLFYSGLCSTINVSVRPSLIFLWRNAVAKPPILRLPNFKKFLTILHLCIVLIFICFLAYFLWSLPVRIWASWREILVKIKAQFRVG